MINHLIVRMYMTNGVFLLRHSQILIDQSNFLNWFVHLHVKMLQTQERFIKSNFKYNFCINREHYKYNTIPTCYQLHLVVIKIEGGIDNTILIRGKYIITIVAISYFPFMTTFFLIQDCIIRNNNCLLHTILALLSIAKKMYVNQVSSVQVLKPKQKYHITSICCLVKEIKTMAGVVVQRRVYWCSVKNILNLLFILSHTVLPIFTSYYQQQLRNVEVYRKVDVER